jgi:hypothetical protein
VTFAYRKRRETDELPGSSSSGSYGNFDGMKMDIPWLARGGTIDGNAQF